jgi:hypothetical protein
MTIIEKNILIAEWLGWTMQAWSGGIRYNGFIEGIIDNPQEKELKFHSDSNWQWVCLEKIRQELQVELGTMIEIVDFTLTIVRLNTYKRSNNTPFSITSKEDLFEAIVAYILSKDSLTNNK